MCKHHISILIDWNIPMSIRINNHSNDIEFQLNSRNCVCKLFMISGKLYECCLSRIGMVEKKKRTNKRTQHPFFKLPFLWWSWRNEDKENKIWSSGLKIVWSWNCFVLFFHSRYGMHICRISFSYGLRQGTFFYCSSLGFFWQRLLCS